MELVIVDNDKSLLRSWELILTNEGYKTICFDNPAFAYRHFLSGAHADILITDYRMPEVNGDQLIRASRKNNFDIDAYVLISGHLDGMTDDQQRNLSADFALKKPLDLQELLQLIHTLQGERKHHA